MKNENIKEKNGWFKRVIEKYNRFCKDFGYDQATCRSCGVPEIKADENGNLLKKEPKNKK
ncbi:MULTISPECIES: DUF5363 domain-containing protein [Basfia]|nr:MULTISPECIES: DUF5363 domain-containing protein [Basfia]QIM68922.1 hypothetical protein A4G13_05730 [Basfia succiniciproducens]SCY01580.1 hypothetical protein SAMN02910354_01169 [Basfia succiniciproducens]SEQ36169.1 hypothetical protein SAMN02910415_01325 [Basfia succiniciproducens]